MATDAVESSLQLGKVQNLRKACSRLHLAEVPADQTFSFWKQIGRATKSRGYAVGRELRQGCLIPTIGGGLCQLSNSLYELALQTGCEIQERHAHTAVVPGSAAAQGRDATVFWNYVDLRFAPVQDLLISVKLSADELILQFLGKQAESNRSLPGPFHQVQPALPVNACSDCGQATCFRHAPGINGKPAGHNAFLIEECWPEFDFFSRCAKLDRDELFIPWHSSLSPQPRRYRWEFHGYSRIVAANNATGLSSIQGRFALRNLPPIALQVQRSRRLANYYSQRLSADASFLYVAQTLLPFVWQSGDLGGRRFAVFLTRMPLSLLHARLDDLVRRFPEQKTFQEFRAPQWMGDAEAEALDRAESVVTPHAWLAGLFPHKTYKLTWDAPSVPRTTGGHHIVFPGPTVARKGAYQLREAMKGRVEELLLSGSNLESDGFWDGVNTNTLEKGSDWLQQARVLVQPAFIENAPRPLLRALAAGVPVIATPECGLDPHPNVTLVEAGDLAGLRQALKVVLS